MLAASLLRRLPAPLLASLLLTSPALAKKELGVNVHQSPTVGVDIARDATLGWVRIDLNWFNVEQAQGKQDWGVIDAVIDAARARNLQVLGVIGYGPAWASSGDTKGDGANNDVPKEGAYAAFVKQVVERYQGKVTHYELWNEPNLGDFFEGTPQDYLTRVLQPGAAALHAACAGCKVVGPGLATVGDQYATWMDTVLGAAKGDIDIVSGHIYAGFPAEGSGVGKTSDSFFNKLESHRVITFEGSVLYEGGLSFKEVMDKHGVSKPFWLTETGRQARLGDAPALEEQRLYYRQTLEAMLSRPWWQATLFYEAFDEAATPDLTWGLGLHDDTAPGGYKPKPAFDLLKQVIAAQPEFGGSKHDCMDFLDNDGDGQLDSADSACSGGSLSEGAASASGSGGSGQAGAGGSGGSGQAGPGGSGQAASGGSGLSGSAPGQGGAGGSGGAGASSGQGGAGKGGSGLKSDLDLNEKPADDGGGCAQGRGATGGGLGVLVAGLAASLRRRRGERRA